MLAKLSADILDKLDIFILEIEELNIPKVLNKEIVKKKISIINFFVYITATLVGVCVVPEPFIFISWTISNTQK